MSYSIDNLCENFNNVSIHKSVSNLVENIVQNDAQTILRCHEYQLPSVNSHYTCALQINMLHSNTELQNYFFNMFPDETKLFNKLYEIIFKHVSSIHFTEMIPLIDEYIEYVFSMSPKNMI
jgi:hypothetical protein